MKIKLLILKYIYVIYSIVSCHVYDGKPENSPPPRTTATLILNFYY